MSYFFCLDDFYIASGEESVRQVEIADEFIKLVEKYSQNKISEKESDKNG